MKAPPKIKASDMLRDLAALMPKGKNGDGMTASELVEASGLSRDHIMRMLHAAKKAGVLVLDTVIREAINGKAARVTSYRIVKPSK